MTVSEFANNLREGIEYHLARGQDDDSQVVARFWAPNDEFMGPNFRPKFLVEPADYGIDKERLYGVTAFQARLCLGMLGVETVPKADGWDS